MEKITLEQVISGEQDFLITDEILPITTKIAVAGLVADEVCLASENGIVICDEVLRDVYSVLYGVNLYTNIEIKELSLDVFDLCAKIQIINELNKNEDYKMFIDVCNKVCKKREKENDLANDVATYLKTLTERINDSLKSVSDLLDKIDPNELNNSFGKSFELLAEKFPNLNDEKTVASFAKILSVVNRKKA